MRKAAASLGVAAFIMGSVFYLWVYFIGGYENNSARKILMSGCREGYENN
jgi:hypothetical protein